MHVLYVHQNFPAQFGHIARHLVKERKWKCTFLSQTPAGTVEGIEKIEYKLSGGATRHNHYCTRTFENTVWHCDGVFRAMRDHPHVRPDLIVGHSGFGSTLFLRELYPTVPVLNFFEYYYKAHDPDSDMDFRRDLGWPTYDLTYLRSRCRNAMILLDLQNCQAAYTPTNFQKSRFPAEYQDRLRVIFDGVDRSVYHGFDETLRPPPSERGVRTIAGVQVQPSTRVVTYVSRGFESMRGFDVFMKAADLIARRYPDVVFLVVGSDRVAYGGDENHITPHKTFKDWTLAKNPDIDLSKFHFVGRLAPPDLAQLLAAGDLHIYLTVPFVLSWSMMDAMSCGAVVLGSDTAPVREMIRDGENGLLADFFSPEAIADKAVKVLQDPAAARPIGRAAEQTVAERYSLEAVIPEMLRLYEETANMTLDGWPVPPAAPFPAATPLSKASGPQPRPPVVIPPAPPRPTPPGFPPTSKPGGKRTPFRG